MSKKEPQLKQAESAEDTGVDETEVVGTDVDESESDEPESDEPESEGEDVEAADAVVQRPSSEELANPAGWSALDAAGHRLRAVLETFSVDSKCAPVNDAETSSAASPGLERLVEVSALLGAQLTLAGELLDDVLPRDLRFGFKGDATQKWLDKMLLLVAKHGLEKLVTMTGHDKGHWRFRLLW